MTAEEIEKALACADAAERRQKAAELAMWRDLYEAQSEQ